MIMIIMYKIKQFPPYAKKLKLAHQLLNEIDSHYLQS